MTDNDLKLRGDEVEICNDADATIGAENEALAADACEQTIFLGIVGLDDDKEF